MRRFLIYSPAGRGEDSACWLETGFALYQPPLSDGQPRPDVVIGRAAEAGLIWGQVESLMPKVVVVSGNWAVKPPETLRELYQGYIWVRDELIVSVFTTIEQHLTEPAWGDYITGSGSEALARDKAISDRIYRFLLQDVFQETMDWVGHTFSVVGHM